MQIDESDYIGKVIRFVSCRRNMFLFAIQVVLVSFACAVSGNRTREKNVNVVRMFTFLVSLSDRSSCINSDFFLLLLHKAIFHNPLVHAAKCSKLYRNVFRKFAAL